MVHGTCNLVEHSIDHTIKLQFSFQLIGLDEISRKVQGVNLHETVQTVDGVHY